MRRLATRHATLVVALAALTTHVPAQDDTRPNYVVILADDLGYADLGCQGSGFYATPAIDALAASGLRFTDGYANAPNCAPTRACLMSGQDTPRHGIYTVGSGARGKAANRRLEPAPNATTLAPDVVTLAECLAARGYATAHVGKWHLGEPGTAGPREQGFDVNVGGTHAGHPKSYFSPYDNAALPDGPEGEYLTDRLTDDALGFLEANRDGPFFLYFAHYAVHTPLQATDADRAAFADREPDGGHRNVTYAGMIRSLDRSVGRVLATLDDLGIADSTVVVFTSDNGGLGGYADLGTRDVTDNRPLRGGKGMLYEGGIRVPWIVRWPGRTTPGTTSAAPIVTYDLFPTLLAAAGAPLDPEWTDPEVDGVDLASALEGATDARTLVWHFPGYLQANAARGTWRTEPAAAIRRGRFKLIEWFDAGPPEGWRHELYDLAADVGESRDLRAARPELAAELRAALATWRGTRHAPLPTAKSR